MFAILPPRVILFGLDDTIVSYHPVSDPAWTQVCNEFVTKHSLYNVTVLKESIREAGRSYWEDPEQHRLGRLDLNN